MTILIVVLQCAVLAAAISLFVVLAFAFISDMDKMLPSFIPRRLRLPFWIAVLLLFCRLAPDVLPPVVDFVHLQANRLVILAAGRLKTDPASICILSFCAGFLAAFIGSAASSLKALTIMAERHRKGMFEELDALMARCPCRPAEDGGKDAPV